MMRGDAVSAVLDHQSLRTGDAPQLAAAITRQAYDFSQRLELKAMAMQEWTNAVFAACDKAWADERKGPRSLIGIAEKLRRDREMDEFDIKNGVPFFKEMTWYELMEAKADRVRATPRRKLDLSRGQKTNFDDAYAPEDYRPDDDFQSENA
jgi:hypothetical protein